MATGTAASGMIAARQLWRNTSITTATRMTASRSVLEHLVDRLVDERRGVVDDGVVESRRGTAACSSSIFSCTPRAVSRAFVPGSWYTDSATDGLPSRVQVWS